MQNLFSRRTSSAVGVALIAIILAASNLHAGLLNIPSEPADWNGPVVGFNVGGIWTDYDIGHYNTNVDLTKQYNEDTGNGATETNIATFSAPGHSSSDASPIGGIDLGYYKQWGMFVLGGVFGFSGSKTEDSSGFRQFQSNSVTLNGDPFDADTDFHSTRSVEQVWSGYAGADLGFAWWRFLFYATGGAAFSQTGVHELDRATTDFFAEGKFVPGPRIPLAASHTDRQVTNSDFAETGWFAGGGLQFAMSNKVSAGVEYRHTGFADTVWHFPHHTAIFPGATGIDTSNDQVLFKVTLWLGHLSEKAAPPPNH